MDEILVQAFMKTSKDLYCWRCKAPLLKDPATTLVGGFTCHICADCRNDWGSYLRNDPLLLRLDKLKVRVQQLEARTMHDGLDRIKELDDLMAEDRQIRNELFNLGQQWVATAPESNTERTI